MLEGEQEEERRRELEKKQRKEKEKLLLQKREIESKLFGDPGKFIFASGDEERSKLIVLYCQ
jgi:hypothetical protein